MTELGVICIILAICIPVTAAISGFFHRSLARHAFDHMERTNTVGGTPREVYLQKADLDMEKQKAAMDAKKPRPVTRHGVIS